MIEKFNKYLTTNKDNKGCYLYIYSAAWYLKDKIVHRYYTGITNDINRRWTEHFKGIKSGWKNRLNKIYYKKPIIKLEFVGIIPLGVLYRKAERHIKQLKKIEKYALTQSKYNFLGAMKVEKC